MALLCLIALPWVVALEFRFSLFVPLAIWTAQTFGLLPFALLTLLTAPLAVAMLIMLPFCVVWRLLLNRGDAGWLLITRALIAIEGVTAAIFLALAVASMLTGYDRYFAWMVSHYALGVALSVCALSISKRYAGNYTQETGAPSL